MAGHDEGSIPGFTPEQAWVINTLQERVATKAAEKAVAALTDKPCPFDCEDVAELKSSIYGDGATGIKTMVTRHDERIASLVWWNRATIAATLTTMGAFLVSLAR